MICHDSQESDIAANGIHTMTVPIGASVVPMGTVIIFALISYSETFRVYSPRARTRIYNAIMFFTVICQQPPFSGT